MKVLYLYSGTRKGKFKGKISVDYPDTQFYGLNHLDDFGVDAEFKEFGRWFLGFRLRHFLSYFLTRGYDLVFGSSILFMMFFKKIFRPKRKFVLLNIGLNRTVLANAGSKYRLKLIKWLLDEIDAIVCLAVPQLEFLKKNFPDLGNKLFFVPLGVDVDFYKPNFKNRKNYILSAGRDNGRDYETVIKTARLASDREFHIVCSERNLSGIQSIPDNVKVFYDIGIKELNDKYHEAKCLLLLTHDDTFTDGSDCSGQTVLLDAIACGLPVVASRKKYIKDYARDGIDILLVDFYNPADVADKLAKMDNDTLRLKISESARDRTEKLFSTRKMAENLANLFKKI